jgi:hypothetical protein
MAVVEFRKTWRRKFARLAAARVPRSGDIVKTRLILVAICGCLLASAEASDTGKPLAGQPTAGQLPRTLEQMPAVPPQVSFQDGQLSIVAQNCTLGEVLKAVHAQTGAQVDLPGPGGDRVIGNFGPGPARDVLAELLNGSHFNYVLLGSETNPQALDRVILTAKTGNLTGAGGGVQEASADSYQNNSAAPQPFNPGMRPMPPRPGMGPNGLAQNGNANQAEAQADDSSDDTTDDSADDSTDADSTDDADQTTDDQQADETTVQGEDPANPGVKTPEQMLQELQQQQQQQQQNGVPQPGTQPGLPPRVMGPGGMVQPH